MRRLYLLALLAYGLIFAGLLTLNGRLLVLVIPLVVFLAAGLLYGPEPFKLRVTRRLSADRVDEESPVTVTLTVTNDGARLEEMLIEERLPSSLSVVDGETRLLATLAPGQIVELSYSVRGRRGSYTLGDIHVTARDHLDLLCRQEMIPTGRTEPLHILPTVVRLRRIAIRPRQTRVYAGTIPARVGGIGVEFFGVRPYQTSDPQRHINWKAIARHPESLYANEFQQERIADVGLIVDARQRTSVAIPDGSLFEHTVRAAAALGQAFLQNGNRVGLLVYGRVLNWTSPGYGKVQRERILRALAEARTGDSQVFDRLEHLPTRFFPPGSQIVLISPLCADDPQFLVRLRALGYELLVISPDPILFEQKAIEATPEVQMAVRIATIERALMFRRLRHAGVRVVNWNVDEPFERAVAVSLARQPLWTHTPGIVR